MVPQRLVAAAAAVLLTSMPVLAQDAKPVDPAAVQALLDTAIEEQTVFLNCSATMETTYKIFYDTWIEGVDATLPLLEGLGLTPKAIADFASRAKVDNILMRKSSFVDVVAFCSEHPKWEEKFYLLNFVLLPSALNRLGQGG